MPRNRISGYLVSAQEFRVMLALFRAAAEAGTLTPDQMAACSHDPHDILIDLKDGRSVTGVTVWLDESL